MIKTAPRRNGPWVAPTATGATATDIGKCSGCNVVLSTTTTRPDGHGPAVTVVACPGCGYRWADHPLLAAQAPPAPAPAPAEAPAEATAPAAPRPQDDPLGLGNWRATSAGATRGADGEAALHVVGPCNPRLVNVEGAVQTLLHDRMTREVAALLDASPGVAELRRLCLARDHCLVELGKAEAESAEAAADVERKLRGGQPAESAERRQVASRLKAETLRGRRDTLAALAAEQDGAVRAEVLEQLNARLRVAHADLRRQADESLAALTALLREPLAAHLAVSAASEQARLTLFESMTPDATLLGLARGRWGLNLPK